ncbi:MAG: hypothetical protein KDD89_10935, partial [Anaerolineales bacterium]|nr:hypothetical protein [Anaerolineales bacterium]
MGLRRIPQRVKPNATPKESFLGRLLDPIDRLSETIYSVLIVLTFTLAYRIFDLGGTESVSAPGYGLNLFWTVLGATFAWGAIDGIMYVLMELFQRGERHRVLHELQMADEEDTAVDIIAGELDHILEPITSEPQRHTLYQDIIAHLRDGQPQKIRLQKADLAGGLGSVLVAMLAIIPSLIPLLIFQDDYMLAIRISNVVSFIVLFWAGYSWGKHIGVSPWRTGLLL